MAVKNQDKKTSVETLGEMFRKFGYTVGEILDDPKVKETAKEFAASVVDAAAKFAESKVKAEELRGRISNMGKAAQTLGVSIETHFQEKT